MDKVRRIWTSFAKRVSWILFVKVALSLAVIVYAASISVTTTTYQAEIGSAVKVANNLLATDKGFTLAGSGSSATGTSCSSPIIFGGSPGTANIAITASHLVYDVQVNSTTSAPVSTKFNVTLVLASTTYGPLCIQTPASPANGQTIDCKFDVGTTLPASPYTFKVTVQ
jgi:hypothetical protein